MLISTLESILKSELGAGEEHGAWKLAEEKKVTLLVGMGETVMPIPRVRLVEFRDEYLAVTNDEGRYFLDLDSVLAVKQEDSELVPTEHRTGFRRS